MTGQRDIASARSVIVNRGGKSLYGDLIGVRRGVVEVKAWGSGVSLKVPVEECAPVEVSDAKEFAAICQRQRGKNGETHRGSALPILSRVRRGP